MSLNSTVPKIHEANIFWVNYNYGYGSPCVSWFVFKQTYQKQHGVTESIAEPGLEPESGEVILAPFLTGLDVPVNFIGTSVSRVLQGCHRANWDRCKMHAQQGCTVSGQHL